MGACGGRCPQRHVVWRWRVRAHQGGTAQGIQFAHHRPAAQRRVAPYTGIPTNLLFFDRSGPTREVWYYEQPLPEGRKNYTKTAPIQFEEFAPLVAWWDKRKETDNAWKVPAAELLANGCNLDRKNPRAREDSAHLPPEQLAAGILQKEQRIAEIMSKIQGLLRQD